MKKISLLSFLCILTIIFTSCNLNFSTFNKPMTNPDNSDLSLSVQNSEYNAEGDNSYLVIGTAQTDNSFAWYQSEDNLKDNYYKGNCAIYTGQAGMDYITKDLKVYGVTEKELERVVKDKEKFIVIHVQYSDMMINGVQQIDNFKNTIDKKNPQSCAYYGQIEENGNLYLVNMMTATPYSFNKN